jgi:hypothetical protein
MAGSLRHVIAEDGTYRGTDLLENMGDMKEAVEEMAFVIAAYSNRWGGQRTVQHDLDHYYRCARGEEPWPSFWREVDGSL